MEIGIVDFNSRQKLDPIGRVELNGAQAEVYDLAERSGWELSISTRTNPPERSFTGRINQCRVVEECLDPSSLLPLDSKPSVNFTMGEEQVDAVSIVGHSHIRVCVFDGEENKYILLTNNATDTKAEELRVRIASPGVAQGAISAGIPAGNRFVPGTNRGAGPTAGRNARYGGRLYEL